MLFLKDLSSDEVQLNDNLEYYSNLYLTKIILIVSVFLAIL